MSRYLWFWAAWLIVGAAYEVWAVWVRPEPADTFSEWTIYVFKTNTKAGWGVFLFCIAALLAWYPAHLKALGGKGKTAPTLVESETKAAPRSGNS